MTRLDVYLVREGYFDSRQKAQDAVRAGLVYIDDQAADKSSRSVVPGQAVTVRGEPGYVGRGGRKLEGALDAFNIDVNGTVVLDAGASTGGFTQCLLRRGAVRVYAVDIGHDQLDIILRKDPRVVSMEGTDIRGLRLPETVDGASVDVSFISLTQVLSSIVVLIREKGFIIALVKPQFEAGRASVSKGGVVKDPEAHARVLAGLSAYCRQCGLHMRGLIPSPIRGRGGNREYLLYAVKEQIDSVYGINIENVVAQSFAKEH